MTVYFNYVAYTKFDATEEELEMLRNGTMPDRVKDMVANRTYPCEWGYKVYNTDDCCPRNDGDEDVEFTCGIY